MQFMWWSHGVQYVLCNCVICVCVLGGISFCTGPPSPITSITATDTSCLTTSVVVSWTPSSGDPVCGPISYNVMISPSDGVMIMSINDTSYNFTALTPGTNYTVSVAAVNMAGAENSDMIVFYIIDMVEAIPSGEFRF